MDPSVHERLQLESMIKSNGTVDYTESIRERKHSGPLRRELTSLKEGEGDLSVDCPFMAAKYPDILARLSKGEMDFGLFEKMLDVLGEIEEGGVGQHEGSAMIGKALKELYVDSALRRKEQDAPPPDKRQAPSRQISYAEYLASVPNN